MAVAAPELLLPATIARGAVNELIELIKVLDPSLNIGLILKAAIELLSRRATGISIRTQHGL